MAKYEFLNETNIIWFVPLNYMFFVNKNSMYAKMYNLCPLN